MTAVSVRSWLKFAEFGEWSIASLPYGKMLRGIKNIYTLQNKPPAPQPMKYEDLDETHLRLHPGKLDPIFTTQITHRA